jgi:hypothetical protein
MRSQVLGQLSERLNYDRLYQEALTDPELRRTRLELEAALGNAEEARRVVFDLFQDLDDFRLDDYNPFSNLESSMERLLHFLLNGLQEGGHEVVDHGDCVYELRFSDGRSVKLTTKREKAKEQPEIELLGLDHPLVQDLLNRFRQVPPEALGISVRGSNGIPAVITLWHVECGSATAETRTHIQPIAVNLQGQRQPALEKAPELVFKSVGTAPTWKREDRSRVLKDLIEPMLQREIIHRGLAADGAGFASNLIGWIEVT